MSKEEQFEHIENKIKEAIQNYQPAFDEEAWVKMEALLDKKEKKPRPFGWLWFLLPLLLAGAGSLYFLNNNKKTHSKLSENIAQISTQKNTELTSKKTGLVNEQNVAENIAQSSLPKNTVSLSANSGLNKEEQITEKKLSEKSYERQKKTASDRELNLHVKINKSKKAVIAGRATASISKVEIDQYIDEEKVNNSGKAREKVKIAENEPVINTGINEKNIVNKNQISDIKKNNNNNDNALVTAKNDKKPTVDIVTPGKKNKDVSTPQKSSSFYFLGSLGADIGSVKLFSFNNSSVAAKYGVGVGYQLSRKWSLQTGFYAGKKLYVAGPNDYHIKRPLPNYVKIDKVNAVCMIYEIPLAFRYDILKKSSLSYYTTIGLSSYLMKKENYNFYTTVYDNPAEFDTTYIGNKHLFSNLVLSAGVEKKISKSLSLQLEPSISLPLSGVGYGKVKLFSTAIMLGIKYHPFKK